MNACTTSRADVPDTETDTAKNRAEGEENTDRPMKRREPRRGSGNFRSDLSFAALSAQLLQQNARRLEIAAQLT